MRVSNIVNAAWHEMIETLEKAQYMILDNDTSLQGVRIEGIITLHEMKKKVTREMDKCMNIISKPDYN